MRLAVDQGGNLIETNEYIWKNHELSHETGMKTTQGDLVCSPGLCKLLKTNLIKGEIYQLVFYTYSFFTLQGSTKYYLFG